MMGWVCFLPHSPPPTRLLPNPKLPPHSPSISAWTPSLKTLKRRSSTRQPNATVTRMSYKSNSTRPAATERLISALSYTLPFLNSLQYGRYILGQYPSVGRLLMEVLLPVLSIYRSVPYASFVAFLGLYVGVVRNPKLSRYVRFNAMQAVILDVLMVLPLMVSRVFNMGGGGLGLGLNLKKLIMVWGNNAVFLVSCGCFVYGVGWSVLGNTPYLPFVADAASTQLH